MGLTAHRVYSRRVMINTQFWPKFDGKLGKATRDAVKQVQLKMGWPADSYPTVPFLAKLQNG